MVNLLIGAAVALAFALLVDVFSPPKEWERALLLSVLAQDAAAEAVNQFPQAHFKQLHIATVSKLKANPATPSRRYYVLERAARGALVRLGRMDDFATLPPIEAA